MPTLTGKSLRLSRVVARLGRSSAVVTRKHSITSRSTGLVGSMVLDGVHALGATSLSLQCTASSDSFVGRIPKGLVLTIAGTDYTVSADAEETRSTNRITVSITSGLVAEAADNAAVTLAKSVTDTHSKVNLRPADTSEVDRGAASRIDVSYVAAFPGHLATNWITKGDTVIFTLPDGRTVSGAAGIVENATWGQRVFA